MTSISLPSLSPTTPADLQASGVSARSHKSQAVPKGNAEKPNRSDDVSDWDHEFKSKTAEGNDRPSVTRTNQKSSSNSSTKKTSSKAQHGNPAASKDDVAGRASTDRNDRSQSTSSTELHRLMERGRSTSGNQGSEGLSESAEGDAIEQDSKQHLLLAPSVSAVLMLSPATQAALAPGDAASQRFGSELSPLNAATTGVGENVTGPLAVASPHKPETQALIQETNQSPGTFSLQMAQSEQPANVAKPLAEKSVSSENQKAGLDADSPQPDAPSSVSLVANGQVAAVQAGSENKQQDSNGEGQKSTVAIDEKPAKKTLGESAATDERGMGTPFAQANPTSSANLIAKQNLSAANSSQAAVPINSAEDAVPTGPVKEMTVRFQDDAGRTVSVRLADQAGEVRVSVRSSDPAAATALRQEMPGLSASLERVGWRLTSSESGPQMPAANETSNQSGDEQNPDRQRQSSDWQQNPDRRRSSGFDQWDQLFTRQ